MLKLIKRGEKLDGKQMSQLKGGDNCGSVNWCQNCGAKSGSRAKFDKQHFNWFWSPIN